MFAFNFCGGGFLGIGPAYYLHLYERIHGTSYLKNMIGLSGASTGSILASGLGIGLSGTDLFNMYDEKGKVMFNKYSILTRLTHLSCPKYNSINLYKILDSVFGTAALDDIHVPIFIPAFITDRANSEKVFDNDDINQIKDAVISSCSAPTYFSPSGKRKNIIDGGMFANDPIAALTGGLNKKGISNYKVISFITPMFLPDDPSCCGDRTTLGWGTYILKNNVARTGYFMQFLAEQMIGKENILRLAPFIEKERKMDDVSDKSKLEIISLWENYFEKTVDSFHEIVSQY